MTTTMEITLIMKITLPTGVEQRDISTEISPQFRFRDPRQSSQSTASKTSTSWLKSMSSMSSRSVSRPNSRWSIQPSTRPRSDAVLTPPESPTLSSGPSVSVPVLQPVSRSVSPLLELDSVRFKSKPPPLSPALPVSRPVSPTQELDTIRFESTFIAPPPSECPPDISAKLQRQHKALKAYLASTHPTQARVSVLCRKGLHNLLLAQFVELSTDIRADLRRRQRVDVYEVQYQPPKKAKWPEPRMRVLQMLGSMDEESFRVLVDDLVRELERRFPAFS